MSSICVLLSLSATIQRTRAPLLADVMMRSRTALFSCSCASSTIGIRALEYSAGCRAISRIPRRKRRIVSRSVIEPGASECRTEYMIRSRCPLTYSRDSPPKTLPTSADRTCLKLSSSRDFKRYHCTKSAYDIASSDRLSQAEHHAAFFDCRITEQPQGNRNVSRKSRGLACHRRCDEGSQRQIQPLKYS